MSRLREAVLGKLSIAFRQPGSIEQGKMAHGQVNDDFIQRII